MKDKEGKMMKRKKILIVDDSSTVLVMEQMILKGSYELIAAKDGHEAVEKAKAELPDLILMDLLMPKMNGIEACKQIRSQEATKTIPIIIVTTRSERENVEAGFENGCNDYITKPFNNQELLKKIKNYIG
jgi:CheY-like chemotaxis protein